MGSGNGKPEYCAMEISGEWTGGGQGRETQVRGVEWQTRRGRERTLTGDEGSGGAELESRVTSLLNGPQNFVTGDVDTEMVVDSAYLIHSIVHLQQEKTLFRLTRVVQMHLIAFNLLISPFRSPPHGNVHFVINPAAYNTFPDRSVPD